MPRIEAGDAGGKNSGGGGLFSGKTLGAVLLIACSVGYGTYQYERFFPSKKAPAAKVASAKNGNKRGEIKAALEKVNLSDDQRKRLAAIDSLSTDTRSKLREAARVLKPEQRKELRAMRAEARKEAKARADLRRAKYFPNPHDAAYAKTANKAIREKREARKKAAAQSGGNPQQN